MKFISSTLLAASAKASLDYSGTINDNEAEGAKGIFQMKYDNEQSVSATYSLKVDLSGFTGYNTETW
tara:strand:+ start:126 stop:326 length:201 start_codon:yes stop_codon:yes gene_type:complete